MPSHLPSRKEALALPPATGLRAARPEEVTAVLEKGLATPGAVIMEFMVEKEECVYPMVPAGKPVTSMLLA